MNPKPTSSYLGEQMPKEKVVGSRHRVLLSRHSTYDAALAAKKADAKYPMDQLQIRRKHDGFHLIVRVSNEKNSTKESN